MAGSAEGWSLGPGCPGKVTGKMSVPPSGLSMGGAGLADEKDLATLPSHLCHCHGH